MTEQNDNSLATPKHDEMIVWSLNKYNILPLIDFKNNIVNPSLILSLKYKEFGMFVKADIFNTGYENLVKDLQNKTHTQKYNETIESNWEVINNDYYTVISHINYISDNWSDFIKIESEIPVTARNGYIVGYLDIKVSINDFEKTYGVFTLKFSFSQIEPTYIEIKPQIYSLGQTLEQIRKYKTYLQKGNFYLLTGDLKFKKAFESQGIKVLTYPENI